jgi:hypothetical protein
MSLKQGLKKVIKNKKKNKNANNNKTPQIQTYGNSLAPVDRDLKSLALYDYYAKNILPSQDKFSAYIKMLHDPRSSEPQRMPLLNLGKSHLRRIKYYVKAKPLSTGTSMAYVVAPAKLVEFSNSASQGGAMFINDANYNPTSAAQSGTWTAPQWDAGIYGLDGMNQTANVFDASTVISASCRISFTGVSNLNKKGKLYIAEDLTNLTYAAATATDITVCKTWINLYPLASLVKLQHQRNYDLINMSLSTEYKYTYVPPYSYSNMLITEAADPASGAHFTDLPTKVFIAIATGLDSATEMQIEWDVITQNRPQIAQLNTYQTRNTFCFENPDPHLRYMESDTNNVISK